jgi:hypothetical protein
MILTLEQLSKRVTTAGILPKEFVTKLALEQRIRVAARTMLVSNLRVAARHPILMYYSGKSLLICAVRGAYQHGAGAYECCCCRSPLQVGEPDGRGRVAGAAESGSPGKP